MSVHLITGDDESLVLTAVTKLVHELVGDGDRSLMVDDLDGDELEIATIVDAAQTPSFLTDRRVVVARGLGRYSSDDVAPLVAYLADPLPTTELVLVGGGGRLAKPLTDAVKRSGATLIDTAPPARARERSGWVDERVHAAGLRLDHEATALLERWMGEDAGRLQGVLDTLSATYGATHAAGGEGTRRLSAADIEPFLGEAGGVPPWDLTDAIDRGDTRTSLELLHRMMGAGDRHPLQVMAILHSHVVKLLRLDGSDAHDEASAAAVLGIKPGYPARKALDQYRRLGSAGVARAMALLAQADLDLRGAKDWSEELVMEVLVARLSRLAPPVRAGGRR
jgi:DNA polymerase-3 subunit delta